MFVFVDFLSKYLERMNQAFKASLGEPQYVTWALNTYRDLNTYTTTRSTYLLFEKCLV